jgi:hypothetical protein
MMPQPARQSDLSLLVPEMQDKVKSLLYEANKAGLKIRVFESLRTRERQAWLYGQGRTAFQCLRAGLRLSSWANPSGKIVTWTMTSQHLLGKAVDIVFIDAKNQPTWSGDWNTLITIGKRVGLQSLAPREMSHFQIS